MAYQALYRTLRPQLFKEIVGQQHIVTTLTNQINNDRISHAYLFCGTRGTGKTSTAKVFSKAINCYNLINNEPCNTCDSCNSINNGSSMDVIEIDAASNNGVDNIREIRDDVNYTPTSSKYKIYIIDEVHMLSTGAFNALLKTLEEPPAHIIFILATTDPQKLPPTILSRCQRFDFKRITATIMATTIKNHINNTNEDITDDAIDYICMLSDGAMRDALSILDQALAFYFNEQITIDKIEELIGSVDRKVYFDFINELNNKNINQVLEIIENIIINGRDIVQFINELIIFIRDVLVAKTIKDNTTALNYSKEYVTKLSEFSNNISSSSLNDYIFTFSKLKSDLKYQSSKRILLETTCIRLCSQVEESIINNSSTEVANLMNKLNKLENDLKNISINNNNEIKVEKKTKLKPLIKALDEDVNMLMNQWNEVIDKLPNGSKELFKANTYLGNIEKDRIYVVSDMIELFEPKKEELINTISTLYNKEFNIIMISEEKYQQMHNNIYGQVDDLKNNQKWKEHADNISAHVEVHEE